LAQTLVQILHGICQFEAVPLNGRWSE